MAARQKESCSCLQLSLNQLFVYDIWTGEMQNVLLNVVTIQVVSTILCVCCKEKIVIGKALK